MTEKTCCNKPNLSYYAHGREYTCMSCGYDTSAFDNALIRLSETTQRYFQDIKEEIGKMFPKEHKEIICDITKEAERAVKLHGQFASLHEAYAVILEELDEVWEHVRKKNSERDWNEIYKEAVQIGAVAVKLAEFAKRQVVKEKRPDEALYIVTANCAVMAKGLNRQQAEDYKKKLEGRGYGNIRIDDEDHHK